MQKAGFKSRLFKNGSSDGFDFASNKQINISLSVKTT